MKKLTSLTFMGVLFLGAPAVMAADMDKQIDADHQPLIVAELFTSQSCSSCPPAETLFSELAENENLLTIEWHVDYWDRLVHRGSKWKDLYSSKAFTLRQRDYNETLRGTRGVYTPQAIVNGRSEAVGSRSDEVSDLLRRPVSKPVAVRVSNGFVEVEKTDQSAEVIFVRLLEQHQTDVKGGENKGRQLHGKNIALEAEILGRSGRDAQTFKLPKIHIGESCAILVQTLDDGVGPVLGAAKC